MVKDKVYEEIIRRARKGLVPLYPALIRAPALERYRKEELERIKKEQAAAERRYQEQLEASRRAERRAARRAREEAEVARGLPAERLHAGGWVKLDKEGNIVGGAGVAAMSPDAARAQGYKWGTRADGRFVPMPGQTPAMSEYFGYLKWKYDKGDYDRVPNTKELIRKEIEKGRAQHGVMMPAVASPGVDMSVFEARRRTVKQAYQQGAAKLLAEKKATEAKIVKAKGKMSATDFEALQNLSTNPTVMKHIGAQEHFKGMSERGERLSYNLAGYKELQNVLQTREKEYAKEGWTPEEIGKYNTLAGQVNLIGSGLGERIKGYNVDLRTAQRSYKQDVGYMIGESPSVIKYQGLAQRLQDTGQKVEGYKYVPGVGHYTNKDFKALKDQFKGADPKDFPKLQEEALEKFHEENIKIPGTEEYITREEYKRGIRTIEEARKTKKEPGLKEAAPEPTPTPKLIERAVPRADVLVSGIIPGAPRVKAVLGKVWTGVKLGAIGVSPIAPIKSKIITEATRAVDMNTAQVGAVQEVGKVYEKFREKPVTYGMKIFEPTRIKLGAIVEAQKAVVKPIAEEIRKRVYEPSVVALEREEVLLEKPKFREMLFEPTRIRLRAITKAMRKVEEPFVAAVPPVAHRIIAGKLEREREEQQKVITRGTEDIIKLEEQAREKGYITGVGPMARFTEAMPESELKRYEAAQTKQEAERAKLAAMPRAHPVRRVIAGTGELLATLPVYPLTITRVAAEAIRRPVAVPAAAVAVGVGYREFARVEPYRFAGQLVGMAAIPALKYSPIKVKPTVVKFPRARGVAVGVEYIKKGYVGYRPVVTVMRRADRRVTLLRAPKVELRRILEPKKPFLPKTPLERSIVARSIGEEATKITESMATRGITVSAKVKMSEVKPVMKEVLESHKVPRADKVLDAIIRTSKEEKAVFYGSIIPKAAGKAVGERGLARIPRDFDTQVPNIGRYAEKLKRNINKATGEETIILKNGHVTVKKTGEKLFDIHSSEKEVGTYASSPDYLGWGLKEERLITVEPGLKTITLSEQASRKLRGAMVITPEERVLISGRVRTSHVFRGKPYTKELQGKIMKGTPKDRSVISGKKDDLEFHHIVKSGPGEVGVLMKYTEHEAITAAMGQLGKAIGKETKFHKLFKERTTITTKEMNDILKYASSKEVKNEVASIVKSIEARKVAGVVKGKITPEHPGRIKDIGDYYLAEKVNIKALRMRGKVIGANRADMHLEKWLDAWGSEIAGSVRKSYRGAEIAGIPEVKPILYEAGVEYPTVLRDIGKYVKFAPPAARIPEVYKVPPYKEPTYRLPYEIYPRAVPTYPVGIKEAMYRVGERYKPREVVYPKIPKEMLPRYPVPMVITAKYPVVPTVPKITIPILPTYPPPEVPPEYPPVVPPKIPPYIPPPPEYVPEYPPYEPPKIPVIRIPPPLVKPKRIPKKKRIPWEVRVIPEDFFKYEEITRIKSPQEIIAGMQKYYKGRR